MADLAKDPVCGMDVDATQGRSERSMGKEFHFCSESCREKFKTNPSLYATGGMP